MATEFVVFESVSKVYGSGDKSFQAVEKADFSAQKGQFLSLLGPSGCGKSTLLMMMAGLEPITRGRIMLSGTEVRTPRRDTGIVFQDPTLLPWKTVIENILFPIEIFGLNRADYVQRAEDLIALVGLAGFAQKKPHELSGGMRQRVAICRALIHDPDTLLMDEPFSALDAITRDEMNRMLSDLLERYRKNVMFVTHSIKEAVFLSDRVLVMGGRPSRIVLDLPIDFSRPRPQDLEDSPAFNEACRVLRKSIEMAHAQS